MALFFVVAAYLFKPSDVGQALTYELAWSQHFDGDTIGGMSLADINNDGFMEVAIAIYERNQCVVFTLAP